MWSWAKLSARGSAARAAAIGLSARVGVEEGIVCALSPYRPWGRGKYTGRDGQRDGCPGEREFFAHSRFLKKNRARQRRARSRRDVSAILFRAGTMTAADS